MDSDPDLSPTFLMGGSILDLLASAPFDYYGILPIVICCVLLFMSALVSGSEVALFSIKPTTLDALNQSNQKADRLIASLLKKPRELLSTILISNSVINVLLVILASRLIQAQIQQMPIQGTFWGIANQDLVEFAMITLGITSILVLLGEVTPKSLAHQRNLAFARASCRFLAVARVLFWPLVIALSKSGIWLEKRIISDNSSINLDEIERAIELSKDSIGEHQSDVSMLKGIVNLGALTVKNTMTPRLDMVGLDWTLTSKEVLDTLLKHKYSRLPVYEGSLDQIKGILYAKDFFAKMKDQSPPPEWHSLLQNALFLPENQRIDDALRSMQHERKHMAIVIDEYGGTEGLVTLQDILEEVFGEFRDDVENSSIAFQRIDEKNYVFEAKTTLSDVAKIVPLEESYLLELGGGADTLGGLVLEELGEIPQRGDEVIKEAFKLRILSLDRYRIKRVHLTLFD
ncbi:MAG: hemolysin family protein [Chitinophagales bacterium]